MFAQFQRARRKVKLRLVPYRAVLGDANGTVKAEKGMYWVRPYDAANENNVATLGAPYRVRAGSALIIPRAGFVVWIGPGPDERPTVIGYDHDDLILKGIDPLAVQPNDPYREWIRLKNIQNFRALPIGTGSTPSMKAQVRQLFYYTVTGDMVRWNGTNADTHVDLTAYVPAAGLQRYVVLWLRTYNPNGEDDIQVTYSSTISSVDDVLSFDELQECADASDPDTIPIQAFRLADAQTALKIDDTIDVDLRQFMNMPQVWGFPNTVNRAYRIHEGFSVLAPSAILIEEGGVVQIQDNALLDILGADEESGGSGGGITQLIGDVTAGPGDGVQVATIPSNTITQAMMTDASIGADELITRSIGLDKLALGVGVGTVISYDPDNTPYETENAVDLVGIAGENLSYYQIVYLKSDDKFWKADADAILLSSVVGIVVPSGGLTTTNSTIIVRVYGSTDDSLGLTNGDPIYLDTVAGDYTQTPPSPSLGGSQIASVRLGHVSSTSKLFMDRRFLIRYMKRVSLADGASTTITHYADVTPSERKVYAMISGSDVAVIETSGGAQDSSRQLRGQSGAGSTTTVSAASNATFALGDSGGNEFKVGQSFTLTAAGQLSSFTVNFGATTGTPSAAPTWSICSDSGGNPGAVLATGTMGTITASADNTVSGLTTPFMVTATTYWLVLELPAQGTNNFYTVTRQNTNPYANGVMKADQNSAGTWNALVAGSDMRCAITVAAVVANDGLAQGFSHSNTTTLSYVDILLKKTGAPAGNLTMAVYSDTGGLPNTVITNGTATVVAASTVTTGYTLIRFTWPTPPSITASTQYHLVLTTSDSASNTAYIEWGIDISSPPYANGVFELLNPTWSNASPAADGIFDLYGVTTTFGEPATIGRWSGGTRDIAVRYDNGSGSSPTTSTTFRNNSGVTLDVTCIVEMR